MMDTLSVRRLTGTARLPMRQTPGSAGYDLYADVEELTIQPGEICRIPTGIAIAIGDIYTAAFISARSGIASKFGVSPANCVGVIDSDYRGEIQVPLMNHGKEPFVIRRGDRIAQLLFAPVFLPELLECESLDETARGAGGFGSTAR